MQGIEQEEEERRLFFVGLTRARKNLELSYYTNPTIPGTYETPSNYLRMLPEELLDWEEKPGSESRKANLQKLRKDTRELIREKKQEEEEDFSQKPEKKHYVGLKFAIALELLGIAALFWWWYLWIR
mgnify:CR=1 FL=1